MSPPVSLEACAPMSIPDILSHLLQARAFHLTAPSGAAGINHRSADTSAYPAAHAGKFPTCSAGPPQRKTAIYAPAYSAARVASAGRREWPLLQQWLLTHLEPALRAWFGSVEVVYEGTSHLSMAHRYVFGYHPHGLFPIGVGPSRCA